MLQNISPESLFEELEEKTTVHTVRSYVCEECNKDWSEIVVRKNKLKVKCPDCKTNTLEHIIFETPKFFVQPEVTTLGQQAERNTKKMSKDEYNEKMDKHTAQGRKGREKMGMPKMWADDNTPKDLHTYTPQQQHDYVVEGKKK